MSIELNTIENRIRELAHYCLYDAENAPLDESEVARIKEILPESLFVECSSKEDKERAYKMLQYLCVSLGILGESVGEKNFEVEADELLSELTMNETVIIDDDLVQRVKRLFIYSISTKNFAYKALAVIRKLQDAFRKIEQRIKEESPIRKSEYCKKEGHSFVFIEGFLDNKRNFLDLVKGRFLAEVHGFKWCYAKTCLICGYNSEFIDRSFVGNRPQEDKEKNDEARQFIKDEENRLSSLKNIQEFLQCRMLRYEKFIEEQKPRVYYIDKPKFSRDDSPMGWHEWDD